MLTINLENRIHSTELIRALATYHRELPDVCKFYDKAAPEFSPTGCRVSFSEGKAIRISYKNPVGFLLKHRIYSGWGRAGSELRVDTYLGIMTGLNSSSSGARFGTFIPNNTDLEVEKFHEILATDYKPTHWWTENYTTKGIANFNKWQTRYKAIVEHAQKNAHLFV